MADPSKPIPLSELQLWMAALIHRRRSLPRDEAIAEQAARHVAGNDRLSAVEQLEIYREQFWLRHTDSLVEDFPGLAGLLSQDDWDHLVFDYLERHVPTSYTLRDLGSKMAEFVAEQDWLPHRELCTDMARLELAYIELFDAPDVPSLDFDRLATLSEDDWQTARVVMNPAFALLRARYAVTDLRRAIRTSEERVPIPGPAPCNLVLYRGDNRRLFDRTVSDGAFALLAALVEGAPLVAACERAMERHPEEQLDGKLMGWFAEWGKLGWIVDVDQSTSKG